MNIRQLHLSHRTFILSLAAALVSSSSVLMPLAQVVSHTFHDGDFFLPTERGKVPSERFVRSQQAGNVWVFLLLLLLCHLTALPLAGWDGDEMAAGADDGVGILPICGSGGDDQRFFRASAGSRLWLRGTE